MKLRLALLLAALATGAAAQEPADAAPEPERPTFRFGGELKAGLRWSKDESSSVFFPFPASVVPAGQRVFMRTPDPGSSLELQHLALTGSGEITSGVLAHFEIRLLDL